MAEASFLDTGVVLGFCFRDDDHHYRCKQYLEDHEFSIFISDHVEAEYLNRKPSLAEEVADGVFGHISDLKRSDYEGQLDSMDLAQIRQSMISSRNEAATTLRDFYQNELPNFVQVAEVTSRLRNLARDIEQLAEENQTWLLQRAEVWEREEEYEEIDDALAAIPWDDRRICLDAHDVVEQTDLETELATTNPQDLTEEGTRALVLAETSIDDIIDLAVRS
jgi:predicted nucleic acid-binding protein